MRNMILLVMVTLDGSFDGPGKGLEKLDRHHADVAVSTQGGVYV